jgi:hypothetical protein
MKSLWSLPLFTHSLPCVKSRLKNKNLMDGYIDVHTFVFHVKYILIELILKENYANIQEVQSIVPNTKLCVSSKLLDPDNAKPSPSPSPSPRDCSFFPQLFPPLG